MMYGSMCRLTGRVHEPSGSITQRCGHHRYRRDGAGRGTAAGRRAAAAAGRLLRGELDAATAALRGEGHAAKRKPWISRTGGSMEELAGAAGAFSTAGTG